MVSAMVFHSPTSSVKGDHMSNTYSTSSSTPSIGIRTRRGLPGRPVRPGARWESEYLSDLTGVDAERTTWTTLTDAERDALPTTISSNFFEMGAHPFLTLTLFIALFDGSSEPLSYQRGYAAALAHSRCPTQTSRPERFGQRRRRCGMRDTGGMGDQWRRTSSGTSERPS